MQGRFYEHMTHKRELYETFEITLKDCPHISPEKIAQIIQEYRENDPYTRSAIYGEFMATDDRVRHVLELVDIESNRRAEIGRLGGTVSAGVDFAAGGDANTVIKRAGNYVPNGCIKAWRERDTHAAIGRYIAYFIELGLEPDQIWADSDGLGLPMCDSLAASGWTVNRFYGGSTSPHVRYKNLISYAWHGVAQKVRSIKSLFLITRSSLVSSQAGASNTPRMAGFGLRPSKEMRDRGLESPDLADAFVMAFGMDPARSYSWTPFDDSNRREIARKHGWDYTGNTGLMTTTRATRIGVPGTSRRPTRMSPALEESGRSGENTYEHWCHEAILQTPRTGLSSAVRAWCCDRGMGRLGRCRLPG
jgi:hypothetical protein